MRMSEGIACAHESTSTPSTEATSASTPTLDPNRRAPLLLPVSVFPVCCAGAEVSTVAALVLVDEGVADGKGGPVVYART